MEDGRFSIPHDQWHRMKQLADRQAAAAKKTSEPERRDWSTQASEQQAEEAASA